MSAPIGFEMQGGGAPANPDQVNVEYPPMAEGVGPSGYPAAQNGSKPAPIGFEAHGAKGQEDHTAVEMEKSPQTNLASDDASTSDTNNLLETGPRESTAVPVQGSEDTSEEAKLIERERIKIMNEEATLYFRDGKRRIDYVLAYEPGSGSDNEKKKERREIFEENLKKEGLVLESEPMENSKSGKTCFIKIHAPWKVLAKYAELTNLKMPLAKNDLELELEGFFEHFWNMLPSVFELDEDIVKPDPNYFTAPFNRDREQQFIIEDKATFFTSAQRSRMVHEILTRTTFETKTKSDDNTRAKFGVSKLINSGVYSACFPLHDGRYSSEHSLLTKGKANDRHLLYEVWAKPKMWFKYQPLDTIRNYFGEKIGIYFAWLGFYTSMLMPASVVGIVAFIYGLATFMADDPSNEICDSSFVLCPVCDGRCSYRHLKDSCNYSKATYLFDNYATVAFAIFMALWASFFMEFWKRKQAEIEYDWDVANFEQDEETVRPEFESSVTRRRTNPITKKEEPFVPSWSKCFRYGTTFTVLVFFFVVVCAAVFGVILYRIVVAAVLYASSDGIVKARAPIIATATAACINLVIIIILGFVYQKIALFLTHIEQHRTQTDWEDAFTFKMYLFQFVNYYASIIYVAFFKGRFVGRPGDYNYSLVDTRQEECDPSGCLIELCIQLAIVMLGKQALNNFKEVILPKIKVWFKSRSVNADKSDDKVYSRWEQDYILADIPDLGLFDEYLEMVIQYGFVTIFVAAFPLAPFFALLNNIIEIRLDAYKFVTQWKRPMAARAQDIGIWFGILRGISFFAIVSNAVIIAFTSEFIPKLVYAYAYSSDHSMNGYTNFSLSVFNIKDFQSQSIPDNPQIDVFGNLTYCRYRDFRYPPANYTGESLFTGGEEYTPTIAYWHVLAARLVFVVVFENLVVFFTWLVMYLIPDIPIAVKMQILRENFLSKEALYSSDSLIKRQESQRQHDDQDPGQKTQF